MKHLKKGIESAAKGLTRITEKLEKLSRQLEEQNAPTSAPARKSPPKKKTPAKKAAAKKASRKAAPVTAADKVFHIINRAGTPVNTAAIRKQSGFDTKKVQPILYRLKKQGRIKSAGKGLYEKT